jgi:hypothetical protein
MLKQSIQTGNRKNLLIPHFKQAIASFTSSIKGIADKTVRHSYASLVLDRFLVLFFLQQRGLLDNNIRYLQHHLDIMHTVQADTFFAAFFLPLCHTTLSGQTLSSQCHPSFGHIPTLAHPLFQQHPIEASYQLQISDESFYKLFHFLEEYSWELTPTTPVGTAPCACPAPRACPVIHHDIFADLLEQRINQKQTGTYYTTDDVTGYVANNTILPAFFHRLQKRCPAIIDPSSAIWHRLVHAPVRYIPAALQQPAYLPKETTQEYQQRQQNFTNLIILLQSGTIRTIDAMVTYNLDLLRFAVDVIATYEDLELLVTLFTELEQLTILDPTCGSGAFLCAALATLQTLYMACLQRMQELVGGHGRTGEFGAWLIQTCGTVGGVPCADPVPCATDLHTGYSGRPVPTAARAILKQIAAVPNMSYFVVRHIIVHNLYGVDLMDEATRVCTLRLYLTILAQTQRIEDVPPLHQIPIHIKTENALVGDLYSTLFPEVTQLGGFAVLLGNPPYIEHSKVRGQYAIDGYEEKSCGNIYAAMLERSLALLHPDGGYIGLLLPMSICGGQRFGQQRVLLTQSLSPIWLANFDIFPCRLFGNAFQRLSILLGRHRRGEQGLPLSGALSHGHSEQPLQTDLYTTRVHRWYTEERPFIIDLLRYTPCYQPTTHTSSQQLPVFPKLASTLHAEILQKITTRSNGYTIAMAQQGHKTSHFVYYQEATNYWVKAVCHIPFYKKNGTTMTPPHGRLLFFGAEQTARIIMALMNSSLFYLWFTTYSDGFHLAHSVVTSFPCGQELLEGAEPSAAPASTGQYRSNNGGTGQAQGTVPTTPVRERVEVRNSPVRSTHATDGRTGAVGTELVPVRFPTDGAALSPYLSGIVPTVPHPLSCMASMLEADLLAHTRLSTRNTRPAGEKRPQDRYAIELTEYQVSYSKAIIDEIDRLLARYYGFTKDELDFIVSYDRKYRMRQMKDKTTE